MEVARTSTPVRGAGGGINNAETLAATSDHDVANAVENDNDDAEIDVECASDDSNSDDEIGATPSRALRNRIALQTDELNWLRGELQESQRLNAEQTKRIAASESAFELERASQIRQRSELESQLLELRSQLDLAAAKDTQTALQSLQDKYRDAMKEVRTLRHAIADKETTIGRLRMTVSEHEEVIALLNLELANKDVRPGIGIGGDDLDRSSSKMGQMQDRRPNASNSSRSRTTNAQGGQQPYVRETTAQGTLSEAITASSPPSPPLPPPPPVPRLEEEVDTEPYERQPAFETISSVYRSRPATSDVDGELSQVSHSDTREGHCVRGLRVIKPSGVSAASLFDENGRLRQGHVTSPDNITVTRPSAIAVLPFAEHNPNKGSKSRMDESVADCVEASKVEMRHEGDSRPSFALRTSQSLPRQPHSPDGWQRVPGRASNHLENIANSSASNHAEVNESINAKVEHRHSENEILLAAWDDELVAQHEFNTAPSVRFLLFDDAGERLKRLWHKVGESFRTRMTFLRDLGVCVAEDERARRVHAQVISLEQRLRTSECDVLVAQVCAMEQVIFRRDSCSESTRARISSGMKLSGRQINSGALNPSVTKAALKTLRGIKQRIATWERKHMRQFMYRGLPCLDLMRAVEHDNEAWIVHQRNTRATNNRSRARGVAGSVSSSAYERRGNATTRRAGVAQRGVVATRIQSG